MRGRFFLATVTGVAFAASILSVAEQGAAKTAEELLTEINGLPEIERQARLEKESRKEGNIVWYTGMKRRKGMGLPEGRYRGIRYQKLSGVDSRSLRSAYTRAARDTTVSSQGVHLMSNSNDTNHGRYVSCVARTVNGLRSTGVIAVNQGSRIVRCAARADVP